MECVSWMLCWRACSRGLVLICLFVVVVVQVGSPAMRMSMPSGKVPTILFGVMSIGASDRRLSHCFMNVRGSCAGY